MTAAEISQYLGLALATIALLGHAKGYFSSGEKKLSSDLAAVEKKQSATEEKIADHDKRIQALEGHLEHMPDIDTAHRLELAMERLSGRLDTFDEKLKPIAATSERMQELLLERGAK